MSTAAPAPVAVVVGGSPLAGAIAACLRESGYAVEGWPAPPAGLAEGFAELETRHGPATCLINVLAPGEPAQDLPDDDAWRADVTEVLDRAFLLMREFARRARAVGRGGAIVNVLPVSALAAVPGRVAEAAVAGALVGLTRSAAADLGRHAIRVNAVAVGPVEGADALLPDPIGGADTLSLGRLGSVAEVATAVEFLAGDAATYVNGAVLAVDGGLTAVSRRPRRG